MRGSNPRRIRSEITGKITGDMDEDVGTAARTRPLSFDEIMLKRRNRKVVEYSNDEEGEVGKISSKEDSWYDSGRSIVDKSNSHSKDTVYNDMISKTNDARTSSYPKKEDKAYKREADNAKRKNKDLHGLEAKFEQKMEKHMHHKTLEEMGKYINHRSNEKMEKVVHHRTLERIEKDMHLGSSEKLEKDMHHRSNDKSEKHLHHRSSEKVEKDARHQANEKTEKDVSYKASQKTERDTSRRSKQNSEKDLGCKSHTGDRDYDRTNMHDRLQNNSEYDYENKHNRDHPTSKNRNTDRDAVASEKDYKRKDRSGDDVQHVNKQVVKKQDSGKRLVSEVSERKEKKDSSTSRHEEARLKRRRSKSPEHNKERSRRSGSLSPRARKYTSSRGDELPDKDRPGKHQGDADRSKMSNGSGGPYHRHGGSSSGLGGYSPRKRKTDAAVRTPSPLKRSPEKKGAVWDRNSSGTIRTPTASVPPAPQFFVQAKPSIVAESIGAILSNSNALNTLSSLPFSNLSAAKNASVDSIQLTQATRPLRRLYVDNVPPSASEKDIMECFNKFLLSSGANPVQGAKPCISCMIHKEKSQALVEFLTPEAASAALAFDSRYFSGHSLKIRRPKDFVELANDFPERSKAGAEALSDIVKDSPHKIFVGGISETLSSEMLLEIVRAFGPLKAFHFEIKENLGEPCAFFEFVDQSVTLKACAALNGMKLGGRVLTVAQASPDASFVETYEALPSYEIPQHIKTLLEKPTEVLKIKNAVDPSAIKLLSETELEEILDDVRQECTRFGSVISVNIVKTVDATIPKTQEAMDVTASSQTSKDVTILEQNLRSELDADLDVDDRATSGMDSPCNVDEKAGVSIAESDRNPKEEQEDIIVEEFRKADGMTEPVKNEDEEAATNHTSMTLVGDDAENKVALREKSSRETAPDVKSEFRENEAPDSVEEGAHSIPGDVGKTNGELQEEEAPVSTNVPSSEVDAKEHSETDDKVNADHIFEPGCIFVEFRRAEGSCMAAHCLHGRVFDGRTVSIEYVPHHLYSGRFPK